MGLREWLSLIGCVFLGVGALCPVVGGPLGTQLTLFNNGRGDGAAVLAIAGVTAAAILLSRKAQLSWLPGSVALGLVLYDLNHAQSYLSSNSNPFVKATLQLEWGWGVMILGAILLIGAPAIARTGPRQYPDAQPRVDDPVTVPPYERSTGVRRYGDALVLACLLVFPPLGLWLMWRGATWRLGVKQVITVAYASIALGLGLGGAMAKTMHRYTSHTAAPPTAQLPAPTSLPEATTVPTSAAGGGIRLVSVTAEATSPSAGDTITLDYTVDNETGGDQSVVLGATIYPGGSAGDSVSDPSTDATVTLSTGQSTYQRQFSLPSTAAGTYDLLATVNAPGFTKTFDTMKTPSAFTVSGAPQPTSVSDPARPGAYTDPNTGMSVTVSDIQGIQNDLGQSVIVFYVRVTNNGTDAHPYNALDFACVDEGDQEHPADAFLPAPYSDAEFNSGSISPADSRAGWDGCQMSTDARLHITWDDGSALSPAVHVWP